MAESSYDTNPSNDTNDIMMDGDDDDDDDAAADDEISIDSHVMQTIETNNNYKHDTHNSDTILESNQNNVYSLPMMWICFI